MSTAFRITGRKRLTTALLEAIAKEHGFTVQTYWGEHKLEDGVAPEAKHLVVQTPSGFVHVYGSAKHWNEFERFGGNHADDYESALDDAGFWCLSEHDRGFFR